MYLNPGESWGFLSENDIELDLSKVIIVGMGNPIPQGDGILEPPGSLTPSPQRFPTMVFYSSQFPQHQRRHRQLRRSSTRGTFLSEDFYHDDNFETQENITIETEDEDEQLIAENRNLFQPAEKYPLSRPTNYAEIDLNAVAHLEAVLPETNRVQNLDRLLPLNVPKEENQLH